MSRYLNGRLLARPRPDPESRIVTCVALAPRRGSRACSVKDSELSWSKYRLPCAFAQVKMFLRTVSVAARAARRENSRGYVHKRTASARRVPFDDVSPGQMLCGMMRKSSVRPSAYLEGHSEGPDLIHCRIRPWMKSGRGRGCLVPDPCSRSPGSRRLRERRSRSRNPAGQALRGGEDPWPQAQRDGRGGTEGPASACLGKDPAAILADDISAAPDPGSGRDY